MTTQIGLVRRLNLVGSYCENYIIPQLVSFPVGKPSTGSEVVRRPKQLGNDERTTFSVEP